MNSASQSDRAEGIVPEERPAEFGSRSRLFRVVALVILAVAVGLALFIWGRRSGWHHRADTPPIFNNSTFDMSSEFAKRPDSSSKLRVLFLCTGNSCRSQMAEGWARALAGDAIEPYSAGIEARGLNPNAVEVMREAGVDISGQRSKSVSELGDVPLDMVITVCGHADEHCPAFPANVKVVHVGFDDPPKLAKQARSREEELAIYRRVRDEIREFVAGLARNGLNSLRRV